MLLELPDGVVEEEATLAAAAITSNIDQRRRQTNNVDDVVGGWRSIGGTKTRRFSRYVIIAAAQQLTAWACEILLLWP